MALRLRRGTEANRTSITPAEGELIYVTDTKKLYSGDGTTAGGVLVTGSGGGGALTGITDNTTGSVLTLGDLVISIDADLSITGYEINGDGDIDITGDITASGAGTGIITANSFVGNVTGDVLGSVFGDDSTLIVDGVNNALYGNLTGYHTGDMTGSVFGNDSTIIIDGSSNTLHGNLDNVNSLTYATPLDITNKTTDAISTTYFSNTGEAQYLKIRRTDSGTAPDQNVGLLAWDQVDDTGTKTYASFAGWHSGLYIGTSSDGTTYSATNYVGITDGNMAIGDYTPAAGLRLDVRGNTAVSGTLTAGAIVLSSSNIDTDDSSAITVTPGVTFSSDVTVENDLIVTNKIVANTIEVENIITNASGTPEITSDTDIILAAVTRVEVSTSPFKLASFTTTERDALSAENGDMIYNTTLNKLQGYENGAWASLI